jgi:hypothetical protein
MTEYPIGSTHIFRHGSITAQFKRVPDGWSDSRGVLWDDTSLADAGWRYVGPG